MKKFLTYNLCKDGPVWDRKLSKKRLHLNLLYVNKGKV